MGFTVLAIFLDCFFRFLCPKKLRFFGFVVHYVWRIFCFQHLVFSFRQKFLRVLGFGIRCVFSVFHIGVPVSLRHEQQLYASADLE